MSYLDYVNKVFGREDMDTYVHEFEAEIKKKQQELTDFMSAAEVRVNDICIWEEEQRFLIFGRTFKEGKNNIILFIKRYEDGTQSVERFSFTDIVDLEVKLDELKNTYSQIDWSNFEEEL